MNNLNCLVVALFALVLAVFSTACGTMRYTSDDERRGWYSALDHEVADHVASETPPTQGLYVSLNGPGCVAYATRSGAELWIVEGKVGYLPVTKDGILTTLKKDAESTRGGEEAPLFRRIRPVTTMGDMATEGHIPFAVDGRCYTLRQVICLDSPGIHPKCNK